MLVTDLRKKLTEERLAGRRPSIVVLEAGDFEELLNDLSIKTDVFDPIVLFGVRVVLPDEILNLEHAS